MRSRHDSRPSMSSATGALASARPVDDQIEDSLGTRELPRGIEGSGPEDPGRDLGLRVPVREADLFEVAMVTRHDDERLLGVDLAKECADELLDRREHIPRQLDAG